MRKYCWIVLAVAVLGLAGCEGTAAPAALSEPTATVEQPPTPTAEQAVSESDEQTAPESGEPIEETVENAGPEMAALPISSEDVDIASGGQTYPSYLSAPARGGPYPGIVLVHSINGMEMGYLTLSDRLAEDGFVVLALGWQTFERTPPDATVRELVDEGIAFLSARPDVDPDRLGLTGFCIGGYYTMLLLPQIDDFKAGVAWYGFPYRGDPQPADLIDDLEAPMLVIHGTADNPSPIDDIYRYTDALTQAGKTFELEVYEGEPHGFMLSNGQLRHDEVAQDAFATMLDFFQRYL
jgi:carboxymethylenebutenolidase